MNRQFFILPIALLGAVSLQAQSVKQITVSNKARMARANVPVVISLKGEAKAVCSALVTDNVGREVPCQLDDINDDGLFDELCFITDMDAREKKTFSLKLSATGTPNYYPAQVYAEMLLVNRKVKETNKQDLYISQLTVNRGTNPYRSLHHHGAAFENDMVAYRIYFDHRQTVDIYGKQRKGLELSDTQFYPDASQKAAGYGDDVLWVGQTLGVGALRGWDGKAPVMLTDVDKRSQRIVAAGPLRTVIEVKDQGWTPRPSAKPITMTTLYTLYAGQRHCNVDVTFSSPAAGYTFATGLINVKQSTEHSNHKGLRGCWGTDWPVSAKDSAGHKRETVGLGIYIPQQYVVSEQPANKDNYAFTVATNDQSLHYAITFGSDNETFGYHSAKEWFGYLDRWGKDMAGEITVEVSGE